MRAVTKAALLYFLVQGLPEKAGSLRLRLGQPLSAPAALRNDITVVD